MDLKYTINELAQEINRSRPVTEKWALKMGFKPSIKVVNNRELKAYEITQKQLEELKYVLQDENVIEASYESHYEPTANIPQSPSNQDNFIDKLMSFNEKYLSDVKGYMERAVTAEAQYKLIETSESNKDNEINRLNAELKHTSIQLESVTKSNKKHIIFYSILGIALISLLGGLIFELSRPAQIKEKIVQVVKLKPVPANMMKYYKSK